MALKQTYLSLKDKLPEGSEAILVMRGRGNDEFAPSRELLEDFNHHKQAFSNQPGFPTAFHYAWKRSDYERRFKLQVKSNPSAMTRLRELAQRAGTHDIYFVCYEGYDKPCHRKLLLEIAQQELHAEVDYSPYLPPSVKKPAKAKQKQPLSLF